MKNTEANATTTGNRIDHRVYRPRTAQGQEEEGYLSNNNNHAPKP